MRSFVSNNDGIDGDKKFNTKVNIGPKLVRMAFHDALDNNNLVDVNGTAFNGRTGIDYCLYSP